MMTRADRILYLFTALLLPVMFYLSWTPTTAAAYADVYVDNKAVKHVALSGQQQLEITGTLGPSILEIDHGKIRFNKSPCKGKVCIHRGWLHRGGEFHACLPNRVSIALRKSDNAFDSINF